MKHVGMQRARWPVRPDRAADPSSCSGAWPVGGKRYQPSVEYQTELWARSRAQMKRVAPREQAAAAPGSAADRWRKAHRLALRHWM
eukprot:9473252-Pyramimonas_sp.AAC.1